MFTTPGAEPEAAGLVAGLLDADTAEVTLRLPPPLDTPLRVERLARAVWFPIDNTARDRC